MMKNPRQALGRGRRPDRTASPAADGAAALDRFRLQHIEPAAATAERPEGRVRVRVNGAESPLAWLARRRLLPADQLQAGERLRAEFTRAQLTPRVTADWDVGRGGRRAGTRGAAELTDMAVAARQRLRHALEAVGPEFSGLLLDVCCFLKRLEEVEHERRWPARSGKVVLQLGLARLARHYGLAGEARGTATAALRTWTAPAAPATTG